MGDLTILVVMTGINPEMSHKKLVIHSWAFGITQYISNSITISKTCRVTVSEIVFKIYLKFI